VVAVVDVADVVAVVDMADVVDVVDVVKLQLIAAMTLKKQSCAPPTATS
jgi:hypothetical protein